VLTPITLLTEEELRYSPILSPVVLSKNEQAGLVGLPCAFCGRFYRHVGEEGVTQVDVSKSGRVERRWYGGEFAWRCWRCIKLGLERALDGRCLIHPTMPRNITKAKMRERIVDVYVTNLLHRIKEDLWNWR